ncbi:hypothetical protein FFF34_016065 [Inquilinus sp. KBS0705]|nr:hypothetical protein FFF34_016065 [Inquilinus sp. KBS0705]
MLFNILTGIILNYQFNRSSENSISAWPATENYTHLVNAPTGGVAIENTGPYPQRNFAVFSYSYDPESRPENAGKAKNLNLDKATFRIKNLRNKNLTISKADFQQPALWNLAFTDDQKQARQLPITVLPGDSVDVNIHFNPAPINERVKPVWRKAAFKLQYWLVRLGRSFNYQPAAGTTCSTIGGQLNLTTNDETDPVKTIRLGAIWEYRFENEWEPTLQNILTVLNLKTKVGFNYFDNGLKGESIIKGSDEVAADYFEPANVNMPVSIVKIASYHGCCTTESADTLAVYFPRQKITQLIQYNHQYSGQMLLPESFDFKAGKNLINGAGPFALKIGSGYTDRNKNPGRKIGIRVWTAIDHNNRVIPDTYILGADYLGKKGTNYDYQDNVYLLKNVKCYCNEQIMISDNINVKKPKL